MFTPSNLPHPGTSVKFAPDRTPVRKCDIRTGVVLRVQVHIDPETNAPKIIVLVMCPNGVPPIGFDENGVSDFMVSICSDCNALGVGHPACAACGSPGACKPVNRTRLRYRILADSAPVASGVKTTVVRMGS